MTDKNSQPQHSKEFFQEQIAILRRQYQFILKRIDHLERQIQGWQPVDRDKVADPSAGQTPSASDSSARPDAASSGSRSASAPPASSAKPSSTVSAPDMEMNFGRYWLNKIGLVIFTLGIGFLITYAFQHFPAIGKITLGYVISVALFALGWQCEHKTGLTHFGRVLLGGGWAMAYFTTFAMHHFEASRIIQSQSVDLFLLLIVVAGMLAHALKYASQSMTAVALGVAYITSTLGDITTFTFISCLLLAVIVLYLVYRYQWMQMLFLGIGLTYGVHHFWIVPNMQTPLRAIPEVVLLGVMVPLDLLFVSAYGLVFLTGLHLIRMRDNRQREKIAVANYFNFFLFFALAYPVIMTEFYVNRFVIMCGTGLFYLLLAGAMKALRRNKLFLSDLILGLMIVTLALPLKFMPDTILWIWLFEIPFLLMTGYLFQEKALRILGYGLSLVYVTRLTSLCVFKPIMFPDMVWLGIAWTWCEFMCLMTAVIFGVCVWMGRPLQTVQGKTVLDKMFEQVLSFLSFWYFSMFIWLVFPRKALAFGLSVEFFLLWVLSVMSGLKRLRGYAYLLLPFILFRNFFVDNYRSLALYKWIMTAGQVFLFFCLYAGSRWVRQRIRQEGQRPVRLRREVIPGPAEGYVAMLSGFVLLVCFIYQYVAWQWVSLALGLAGVALIAWGMTGLDKPLRMGGLMLLGLTLLRIMFVDLAHLDVIFKIISFILLGGLFLLVSYVYNCSRERIQGHTEK